MTTFPCREGFIPVRGGRVWYQVIGEGDAIPLLTLHGGPGVPHDYLETLDELVDERPVIFYDQLGCGRSDRPEDVSLYGPADAAATPVRKRRQLTLTTTRSWRH